MRAYAIILDRPRGALPWAELSMVVRYRSNGLTCRSTGAVSYMAAAGLANLFYDPGQVIEFRGIIR
jgi:hypothetical protein